MTRLRAFTRTRSMRASNICAKRGRHMATRSKPHIEAANRRKTAAVVEIARLSGVCGVIHTQTTDVEGEVNGLLTYDGRVEKLSPDWLRSIHAGLTKPAG